MPHKKFICAVIGLSDNPERYAYKAAERLLLHGYPVIGYGLRPCTVMGISVITNKHAVTGIDTVTLYVGPARQDAWLPLILDLAPRRVILNPGTENHIIEQKLIDSGIEVIEACTLVMLATGEF